MKVTLRAVLLTLVVALCACSHGSIGSGVLPQDRVVGAQATVAPQQSVVFALSPQATTPKGRSVRQVVISYPGNRGKTGVIDVANSSCSPCTASVAVDPTTHLFSVDTFDAKGNRLSRTWIFERFTSISVDLTLASTVSSVTIGTDDPLPAYGKSARIKLYVNALDSQEYVIGPGTFSMPVWLRADPATQTMSLSSRVLRTAGDPVPTVMYRGGFESARIVAAAAGQTPSQIIAPLVPVKPLRIAADGDVVSNLTTRGRYFWVVHLHDRRPILDRIDASGNVTSFRLPARNSYPGWITAGATGDGVWYGGCNPTYVSAFHGGVAHANSSMSAVAFYADTDDVCGPLTWGPDGHLWFASRVGVQRVSPSGTFTQVATQAPVREASRIVFVSDGSFWAIHDWDYNGGKLDHYLQDGTLLGERGSGFFDIFPDGSDRFAATGRDGRTVKIFDKSGALLATHKLPQLPLFAAGGYDLGESAVARDGALWIGLGSDNNGHVVYAARLDRKAHMSEVALPAVAAYQGSPSFLSTASGDLWFTAAFPVLYKVVF